MGRTALVTYALLECGVSVQHPKMVKALDYLAAEDTVKTYSLPWPT